MQRNIQIGLLTLIAVLLSANLIKLYDPFRSEAEEQRSVHDMVIQEMEGLGRMELVRYQFRDMVTHERVRDWFPDPSVRLVVVGEAVGCLDLTRIDSSQVTILGDSLYVQLPAPELCYVKIDHTQSRVYDTRYTFWEQASLVDEAYTFAEREIESAAKKSGIDFQTRRQAYSTLVPMLETLTGKTVFIEFPPLINREVKD